MSEASAKELHTSVRQLVEFMLRSGDIDSFSQGVNVNAMLEGGRIHRMLQKRMGDKYRAEVPLSYEKKADGYTLVLKGRADGIYTGEDTEEEEEQLSFDMERGNIDAFVRDIDWTAVPMIDEIKGTYRDVTKMEDADPVHLAQAKCYAYMYALSEHLPHIRVRMTYCNFRTEEIQYFRYRFFFDEIREWFEELIAGYMVWTDYMHAWGEASVASIRACEFPYTYRKGQRDLAVAVYGTIVKGRKLFLNAPTGSGKTIATVFPAVKAIGEGKAGRLFYLTAKTMQRTVAAEAFDVLRREQGLKFKTVTLTAKEKICPMDETDCRAAVCPYAKGHYDRVNDALFALITGEDAMTRDTIARVAEEHTVCPFELSLDATLFADGIICDYNYLFDPFVYLKRFFAEGETDHLFLIDEAHNLVERGREMYSSVMTRLQIRGAVKAVAKDPLYKEVRKHLNRAIRALDEAEERYGTFGMTKGHPALTEALKSFTSAALKFQDDHPGTEMNEAVKTLFFDASKFLAIDEMSGAKSRYFVEEEDGVFGAYIRCMDPSTFLGDAMKRGVASILFSATLSPLRYYRQLLGGEEEDFQIEAEPVFDESRCARVIVQDVSSRYTERSEAMYARIARVIHEVATAKSGRYLVFFPSYAFLNAVKGAFDEVYGAEEGVEVIVQSPSMEEAEREAFLQCFTAGLPADFPMEEVILTGIEEEEESLVGFCIMGGVFSEGIDLKFDALIGVISVGCGIPQVGREREMLKEYFDGTGVNGFDHAYRFPGMNKVLQAAGRVIRTAEDVGIVALLDTRFTENAYRRLFPRAWGMVPSVLTEEVNAFLTDFWQKWDKMDRK